MKYRFISEQQSSPRDLLYSEVIVSIQLLPCKKKMRRIFTNKAKCALCTLSTLLLVGLISHISYLTVGQESCTLGCIAQCFWHVTWQGIFIALFCFMCQLHIIGPLSDLDSDSIFQLSIFMFSFNYSAPSSTKYSIYIVVFLSSINNFQIVLSDYSFCFKILIYCMQNRCKLQVATKGKSIS